MSGKGAPILGSTDGTGLEVVIVAGMWHPVITDGLIGGAQRALSECLPGTDDGQRGDVTHRCRDADGDVPTFHEMDRVAQVAFVKDDLASFEPSAPGRSHAPPA